VSDDRHGTRKDDDVFASGPYRDGFWEAIAKNREAVEMVKMEIGTLENAVMRFERLSDGLSNDMKQVRRICEMLNETLIKLDARITSTEEQIKSIWSFPMKIAGAIIAVGGASAVLYGFLRWFIPTLEIKVPPQ
jgi:hypothetical protein